MLSPMSRASVYRDLVELGIKPLGIRQRPQRWPEDAADKIRARRGINLNVTAPLDTAAARLTIIKKDPWRRTENPPAKLPSMAQLRKERKKAGSR